VSSVCCLSVRNASIVAKPYIVGIDDGIVGYGDDEFLWDFDSNHVSICSGLTAILNA